MLTVSNPTSRDKAVRANGGLVTIHRGKSVDLNETWSADDIARYEAAGLVIAESKKPKPKAKTAKE